jgi:hypothetical protein
MYGDNTAALRDALATLMQVTRNQHGLDILTRDDVALIASFRTSLTLWCQHAIRASNPDGERGGATPRTRGPAEELRYRLDQARSTYTAPLPDLGQLAEPHPNHVVDLWRRAAKATVLGEHDFPAGLDYGNLTEAQAMTVLKDAAEFARALTGLDRRFAAAVPDWEPITEADELGRAAVVCAAHAGYDKPDYSVDQRGWRPPARLVNGPALPGIDGVLQAQSNLLVHLCHQPDAYSLRLIVDSQRIVSRGALELCTQSPNQEQIAAKWDHRYETYRQLIDHSRNLRGLVGNGLAAADGALAAARMNNLSPADTVSGNQLRHLDALFTHIDRRIAAITHAGASDRSYLLRVTIPRIDLSSPDAVKEQRARHVPLDVPTKAPLLVTVDLLIRTPEPSRPDSPTSATERAAFVRSINGPTENESIHRERSL